MKKLFSILAVAATVLLTACDEHQDFPDFLFDGKCEAWLQPGVKANIKGALSVSVFNDKLDFSCRVSEMSEYVPQPYNG